MNKENLPENIDNTEEERAEGDVLVPKEQGEEGKRRVSVEDPVPSGWKKRDPNNGRFGNLKGSRGRILGVRRER